MNSYILISQQMNDWSSSIGRSFSLVLIMIVMIAAAFLVTKRMGIKFRGFSGRNLKIIEGISIGQGAGLFLVKAGSKYILVGVTKEKITYLAELNDSDISLNDEPANGTFEKYLNNLLKGKKNER